MDPGPVGLLPGRVLPEALNFAQGPTILAFGLLKGVLHDLCELGVPDLPRSLHPRLEDARGAVPCLGLGLGILARPLLRSHLLRHSLLPSIDGRYVATTSP